MSSQHNPPPPPRRSTTTASPFQPSPFLPSPISGDGGTVTFITSSLSPPSFSKATPTHSDDSQGGLNSSFLSSPVPALQAPSISERPDPSSSSFSFSSSAFEFREDVHTQQELLSNPTTLPSAAAKVPPEEDHLQVESDARGSRENPQEVDLRQHLDHSDDKEEVGNERLNTSDVDVVSNGELEKKQHELEAEKSPEIEKTFEKESKNSVVEQVFQESEAKHSELEQPSFSSLSSLPPSSFSSLPPSSFSSLPPSSFSSLPPSSLSSLPGTPHSLSSSFSNVETKNEEEREAPRSRGRCNILKGRIKEKLNVEAARWQKTSLTLLHSMKIFFLLLKAGFSDACNVKECVQYFQASLSSLSEGQKTTRNRVVTFYKSILLWNGLLWASSLALEYVMGPLLASSAEFKEEASGMTFFGAYFFEWFGYLFGFLAWLCPLYLVNLVLNCYWLSQIASALQSEVVLRRNPSHHSGASSSASSSVHGAPPGAAAGMFGGLASEIYYSAVLVLLTAVGVLISFIPTFGFPLSLCHFSLLYGLFAFEYRWRVQGQGKGDRVSSLDRHWVYFLGFGAPITLLSSFFSFFVSAALYYMLFPLFVIMAFAGKPMRQRRGSTCIPERISFAAPAMSFVDWGLKVSFSFLFGIDFTAESKNIK